MDTDTLKKAYQDAHDNHIMTYRKGRYAQERAHEVGIEAVQTAILDHLIARCPDGSFVVAWDNTPSGRHGFDQDIRDWLTGFKGADQ